MRSIFTAIALLLFSTAASAAPSDDALEPAPPKPRSADQIECLQKNSDNHPGYLACIRAKKGLKDDDSQGKSGTGNAPIDANMGAGIR